MGYEAGARTGATPDHDVKPSGGAPGKSTRTAGLPAHREMTGIEAVDLADAVAAQDERDGFTPAARGTTVALVTNGLSAVFGAMRSGIARVSVEEQAKRIYRTIEWMMVTELAWRGLSAVATPYLAQGMALAANGFAVPAAEIGLTRAAWVLAADAKAMQSVVTTGLTSLRTHLAHPVKPPGMANHMALLALVESALGPAQLDFMEAALRLPTRDMLGLYSALRAPEMTDASTYAEGARRMVQMFDDNRIPQMGDLLPFYGGLDVATVRRVRINGREYLVLLASRGSERPAEGGGHPDDHVFIRFVETPMHDLAKSELKKKRGDRALEGRSLGDIALGVDRDEVINLNRDRSAPWANDALAEYNNHRKRGTLGEIGVSDEDPFALHLEAGDAP